MKCATRMLALALTMLPLLAAAQLRSSEKLVAQVPFEFMVANKHIPAGECIVQSASMGSRVLSIGNVAAKVNLFVTAIPDQARGTGGSYALVFHKYGDRYFLAGIKLGDRTIERLPESRAEAEMRAENMPSTEKTLVASLR